jgi:hypothetical protein
VRGSHFFRAGHFGKGSKKMFYDSREDALGSIYTTLPQDSPVYHLPGYAYDIKNLLSNFQAVSVTVRRKREPSLTRMCAVCRSEAAT